MCGKAVEDLREPLWLQASEREGSLLKSMDYLCLRVFSASPSGDQYVCEKGSFSVDLNWE